MAATTPNLAAILPSQGSNLVLEERPIPSPGPGELLIRNHVVAANPVDVTRQTVGLYVSSYPVILGIDVSGVVTEVGADVTLFKPGDRVLAPAPGTITGNLDHGAFQTYTVVQATAATKLPDTISFQQGASLPTAVATASIALFDTLGLPAPGSGTIPEKSGILVWGGASSAGSGTIQLARIAGLTVFATASPKHHTHVRSLGATAVVDYRSPTAEDELVAAAKAAGTEIRYAVDAISTAETLPHVVEVLSRFEGTKKLTHYLPWPEQKLAQPDTSTGIEAAFTRGTKVWNERRDLAEVVFNGLLKGWLEKGEVVPQVVKVVDGGIGGLQAALDELKNGVSGVKVVVEV